MKIGEKIPDLALPATGGQALKLRGLGKPLVVYFYPKDNTPGCTQEGMDFRDLYKDFKKAGAEIVGISRDSVRSHESFCTRFAFPFPLLSDTDETACKAFDVIREKSLYGRQYRGIDRSTFLFGATGKLAREWRSVKVKNHAAEVLDALKQL